MKCCPKPKIFAEGNFVVNSKNWLAIVKAPADVSNLKEKEIKSNEKSNQVKLLIYYVGSNKYLQQPYWNITLRRKKKENIHSRTSLERSLLNRIVNITLNLYYYICDSRPIVFTHN